MEVLAKTGNHTEFRRIDYSKLPAWIPPSEPAIWRTGYRRIGIARYVMSWQCRGDCWFSSEGLKMSFENLTTTWTPRSLSVLRIMSALLFMEHGTLKILGFPASDRPAMELLSLGGIAGFFELFGGALLFLGLFTRPVAFLLSGVMAFAYFIAHAPRSFFPVLNGGDAAILYCFVFLYFAFAGGGAWSIDAFRAKSSDVADRKVS